MKLILTDANRGILTSILNRTGGFILYQMLIDSAKKFEERFNKDQIPESYRIGAQCSVVACNGLYAFTLERGEKDWALISFEQKESIVEPQGAHT